MSTPARKKRAPSRRKAQPKPAASERQESGSEVGTDSARSSSLLERVVAALGCIIVAGVIGYMSYLAVSDTAGPADIRVVADAQRPLSTGFIVPFRASNEGGSTAAQVQVEARLVDGTGETVEEAQATLDYLPKGSNRTGGLMFSRDPSAFRLELRATGYEDP